MHLIALFYYFLHSSSSEYNCCPHFLKIHSIAKVILQGQIQDSGKGVHIYKGVGVGFADFISFFLNIPRK